MQQQFHVILSVVAEQCLQDNWCGLMMYVWTTFNHMFTVPIYYENKLNFHEELSRLSSHKMHMVHYRKVHRNANN